MSLRELRSIATWAFPAGRRGWIGVAALTLGVLVCILATWRHVGIADPRMAGAATGGLIAAAATALGTLPVLLSQRISQPIADAMLGFGAGVMLAATSFSLVIPALGAAGSLGHGPWSSGGLVALGILLGAACLLLADRFHSQEHAAGEVADARELRGAWVFVGAILLHNIPEGLAIGVAFAGADLAHAKALATGISIQDVPEGLVVALALRGAGYGRLPAVGLGVASGLVEPIAAVLGAAAVTVTAGLLPWGLAFAAGAMLYAVSHVAIPGSHQKGNSRFATTGVVLGFILMMLLDTALAAP